MAWETRKRGGRYYYRSRRVGRRVIKEYVGSGAAAELIAETDRKNRAKRQEATEAVRRAQNRLNDAAEPLIEFSRNLEILVQAALLATGFYCRRGEWRRGRANKTKAK